MGYFEYVSLSMLPTLRQERGKYFELTPYKSEITNIPFPQREI